MPFNTEILTSAQALQAWATEAAGALGVQIWVADDMGLHPRAVLGPSDDEADRRCARQCCVQASVVVSGVILAVPLRLTDPGSGACVFLLKGDAQGVDAAPFQARVDALSERLDTAVQSERFVRLSGLARQSDLLRSSLSLAHALEHCAHVKDALAELHLSLKKLIYAENFFVVVLDEARETLVFEYFVDVTERSVEAIPFREGRLRGSLSAAVVSAGRVLRGSSRELLERVGHVDTLEDGDFGANAVDWLGVPMVVAGETIGAVVVQSYDPAIYFADSDPSMLSIVAEALAAAFHRRRARAALERTVTERTTQYEQSNQALQETVQKLERAMSQLVQAEKLASLGSMVAGISHELNTPVGIVLTVATAMEERFERITAQMSDGKLTRKGLEEFVISGQDMARLVVRSTQTAAALVASFKQVAVDQTSQSRRSFDLRQVVEDILTTMGPTANRPAIHITNALADGMTCDSYPGPLAQVIVNLVQNALTHAFAEGDSGTIRLEARQTPGQRIVVTVTDDGMGMSPHLQARAFDPFFTTKLGQGGSGLGLAVCHRIVTSVLGGELTIVPVSGCGTCFSVDVPMVASGRL